MFEYSSPSLVMRVRNAGAVIVVLSVAVVAAESTRVCASSCNLIRRCSSKMRHDWSDMALKFGVLNFAVFFCSPVPDGTQKTMVKLSAEAVL